ncbi:Potassium channel [Elasticomyces elasticus]|nr:Potassium channel [Elasticomyces elasticus]
MSIKSFPPGPPPSGEQEPAANSCAVENNSHAVENNSHAVETNSHTVEDGSKSKPSPTARRRPSAGGDKIIRLSGSSAPGQDVAARRRSSVSLQLKKIQTKQFWKFKLRSYDDNEEQLLAATLGPLANVLSIAALVTSWRMCLVQGIDEKTAAQCIWDGDPNLIVSDLQGLPFADPTWCYWINVVSLIMGFVGNLFLLLNFTNRIRYIIALPMTILMWYVATGMLIGIAVSMQNYVPPLRPQATYTQGFWYGVEAAVLYLICSMLLMVNMLGYFLGHYPQHFVLTDSQRTLILQTMLFFVWLAGGGAMFSRIESNYGTNLLSFTDAMYFCDVTILTVGFGDIYMTSDVGRGLVFPYSVGGIIMLGLMISSITRFAAELGSENVIKSHVERSRVRTIGRTVTSSMELQERTGIRLDDRPAISDPLDPIERSSTIRFEGSKDTWKEHPTHRPGTPFYTLRRVGSSALSAVNPMTSRQRKPKLLLLREEKDRFDAMRAIQQGTAKFKRWYALCLSVIAFGLLWCVGAVVFWHAEQRSQQMTYFQAIYFCYVSLLTVGYGDLAPKSNAGRPFFVVWSLIAVPTMTILVSDMGDTVISNFKHGTGVLADFTVLPKAGIWRKFLEKHPWLLGKLQSRKARHEASKRIARGFETGPEEEEATEPPTIDELAKEIDHPSNQDMARKLALAIRRTANDLKLERAKRYTYEEWVEYTRLIRFTSRSKEEVEEEEEEEGLIEWDWIGEDSPMMARGSEAEFVLDRLCESMSRYIRRLGDASKRDDTRGLYKTRSLGVFEKTDEVEAEDGHEVNSDNSSIDLKRHGDYETAILDGQDSIRKI